MSKLSSRKASALRGQNLWLRLLILIIALFAALDASWRQIILLMALFWLYMLLDLSLYLKFVRGLRITVPFLAAYWIFGTLFKSLFPDMLLFTLKLIFFIEASVHCFGNLSLGNILRDTSWLRQHRWGRSLLRFVLATALYIRAYGKHFSRSKIKGHSSLGSVLDGMIEAGTKVFQESAVVEAQLERMLQTRVEDEDNAPANLIALSLMTLMVLISSV